MRASDQLRFVFPQDHLQWKDVVPIFWFFALLSLIVVPLVYWSPAWHGHTAADFKNAALPVMQLGASR